MGHLRGGYGGSPTHVGRCSVCFAKAVKREEKEGRRKKRGNEEKKKERKGKEEPCNCSAPMPPSGEALINYSATIRQLFVNDSSTILRRFFDDSSTILRRFFDDSSTILRRFFDDSMYLQLFCNYSMCLPSFSSPFPLLSQHTRGTTAYMHLLLQGFCWDSMFVETHPFALILNALCSSANSAV